MTKNSINESLNIMTQRVKREQIIQALVAHSLLVASDRPCYDEDDPSELLGHWQTVEWTDKLKDLAGQAAGYCRTAHLNAAVDFVNSDLGDEW
jgi:hypothetical protein